MHNNLGTMPAKPFRFVAVSGNKKTGPIPVTSTAAQSCPVACPMRTDSAGGCYAASGNSAIHWRALSQGRAATALDVDGLYSAVSSIPKGKLWRHNESGDLLSDEYGFINAGFIWGLVHANKGRRGFTYTHHAQNFHNLTLIQQANREGFTINISTNNIKHAIETREKAPDVPIVTIVSEEQWGGKRVINMPESGVYIARCPAEYNEGVTCKTCGICQVSSRKAIVGFTPHGTGKRRVINIVKAAAC